MTSSIEKDLQSKYQQIQSNPDIKERDKKVILHKTINEISKKILQNQYEQKELREFFTVNAIKQSESHLKAIFLNYINITKNENLTLEALQSEDEEIVEGILKICDFYWKNEDHTPEYFMKSVFPKVSYSQRNKILKKIGSCLNQETVRMFFDQINDFYGMKTVRPLIKYCPLNFWTELLDKEVILEEKELLEIFENRSKDILIYLQKLNVLYQNEKLNQLDSSNYTKLYLKLFRLYPKEAIKLIDNDKKKCLFSDEDITASRRLTKKFAKVAPDFVIKDKIKDRYNSYILMNSLNKDQFAKYLSNYFPKEANLDRNDIPGIDYKLTTHLNKIKSSQERFKIFSQAYKHAYGKELLDNPKNITRDLLRWIEDNELRHKLALEKYENGDDTEKRANHWVSFMKTDVSIPKFKELLEVSNSVDDRSRYLKYLLKTCKYSNDKNSLLEILKLFNTKHKNEMSKTRFAFISKLNDLYSKSLSTFETPYWDEIYKIFCNFDIKSELTDSSISWGYESLFIEPMKLAVNTNNKVMFEKWFKIFVKWTNNNNYKFEMAFEKVKNKNVLLWAADYITPKSSEYLIQAYFEWNQRKDQKDPIDILHFEWAKEIFYKKITTKFDETNDGYEMLEIIQFLEKDKNVKEYYSNEINSATVKFLTKCNADYSRQYSDTILKYIENDEFKDIINDDFKGKLLNSYFEYFKDQYTRIHWKLIELNKMLKVHKFREYLYNKSLEILNNTETDQNKFIALKIVLKILKPEEFKILIDSYFPTEGELEIDGDGSDELRYKYSYQKEIVCSMKKYRTDPDILKDLKKFCHGDFLQLAIGSLISICLKIPYYKSKEFLKDNINVPVSFKKHIMRLQQTILDKPTIISLLTDSWIKEKNPSIRKVLLTKILEYFNYELEKESWWKTLENCIEDLNEKDIDSLETLGECKNIPKEYLSRYCKSVWDKLLKLEDVLPGPQILKTRIEIISQAKNNIDYMDDSIIEVILEGNLFSHRAEESLLENLLELGVNYMLLKEGDEKKHVEFILQLYSSSIFQDQESLASAIPRWDIYDEEKDTYPLRELFSKFLKKMYQTIIKKDKMNNYEFINVGHKLIETVLIKNYRFFFSSHQRIFIYINLYNSSNKNLLEFGKFLNVVIKEEVKIYGNIVILKIADELEEFLDLIKENMDDLKVEDLIEGLLSKTNQDVVFELNELLVYHLLNKNEILNDKSVKRKYNKILELSRDVVVNSYLNNYY